MYKENTMINTMIKKYKKHVGWSLVCQLQPRRIEDPGLLKFEKAAPIHFREVWMSEDWAVSFELEWECVQEIPRMNPGIAENWVAPLTMRNMACYGCNYNCLKSLARLLAQPFAGSTWYAPYMGEGQEYGLAQPWIAGDLDLHELQCFMDFHGR